MSKNSENDFFDYIKDAFSLTGNEIVHIGEIVQYSLSGKITDPIDPQEYKDALNALESGHVAVDEIRELGMRMSALIQDLSDGVNEAILLEDEIDKALEKHNRRVEIFSRAETKNVRRRKWIEFYNFLLYAKNAV